MCRLQAADVPAQIRYGFLSRWVWPWGAEICGSDLLLEDACVT